MSFCPNCGNPVPENARFCKVCGNQLAQNQTISAPQTEVFYVRTEPEKQEKKQSGLGIVAFIFSLTILLAPLGLLLGIIDLCANRGKKHGLAIAAVIIGSILTCFLAFKLFSNGSSSQSTNHSSNAITTESAESRKAFIDSCESIKYDDVERDPSSFKGKRIKIQGTVVQVSEGAFDYVTYRVSTDKDGYGDIWLVTYKRPSSEKRVLEDDKVIIYGTCEGVESYTSVIGSTITVPSMNASYIDIID